MNYLFFALYIFGSAVLSALAVLGAVKIADKIKNLRVYDARKINKKY